MPCRAISVVLSNISHSPAYNTVRGISAIPYRTIPKPCHTLPYLPPPRGGMRNAEGKPPCALQNVPLPPPLRFVPKRFRWRGGNHPEDEELYLSFICNLNRISFRILRLYHDAMVRALFRILMKSWDSCPHNKSNPQELVPQGRITRSFPVFLTPHAVWSLEASFFRG